MVKTGTRYKQNGYSPNYSVLIIPGLCSSAMKVAESPHKEWIDKRIWLDITTIGFGKVWDVMKIKKKTRSTMSPPVSSKDIESLTGSNDRVVGRQSTADLSLVTPVGQEAQQNKRKWIAHMVLEKDGVTDPPGIKLRPIETIHGIMYLDPGAITNALSYVFGPLVETLWEIGYTDANLRAAPYDWRIPPKFLQSRDRYFTKLKEKIDDMVEVNSGKKVIIVAHSLGTRCTHYFLRFAEQTYGREWISEHIHTWIAVGPLFLGAPKSVRATVCGERMGLDAFLFPEEGVLLSRHCGSSAWMYPFVTSDFEFTEYVYRNVDGQWKPQTLEKVFQDSDIQHIHDGLVNNYLKDPLFGSQEDNLKAPPVDRLLAIYGINLKTECFYFMKPSDGGLTKLELDTTGEFCNYVCQGGIAYETKDTKQNKLRGEAKGGDGTVPYASLSYCTNWKNSVQVTIQELEGAEHREILKDKTFTRTVVEYVCHAPPPPNLPDTFKDLSYEVVEIRGNKKAQRTLMLTTSGVRILRSGSNAKYHHQKYTSIIRAVEDAKTQTVQILYVGNTSAVFYCTKYRELQQEICIRTRFIEAMRPSNEETVDENGQTKLHLAVIASNIARVRELLSEDCDVNSQDNLQWTPLHFACHKGYWDIAQLLLSHPKIDTSLKTKDFTPAIWYAMRAKDTAYNIENIWDAFLAAGTNVNTKEARGETLLHEAVATQSLRGIEWLIKQLANVNARTDSGDTPLHFAVQQNNREIISLLLVNGADRHIQNKSGRTPLTYAQQISSDLMTFLRDFRISGYQARALFNFKGVTDQELVFEEGDRINNVVIKSDYGAGWWYGECNGLQGYFPSNYAKISEQITQLDRPPLGSAEPEDGPLDTRDEYGQTPLHKAAFEDKCEEVFKMVISGKHNVNAQDRNGWTPAHCAASKGALEVLLLLQQQKSIDLKKSTSDGTPALHYVVRIRPNDKLEEEKLKSVLSKFIALVGPDMPGKAEETALHQAVMRSNRFTTQFLLDNKANVNAMSDTKTTPLVYAVQSNSMEIVKLLIDHKADPTIAGKRGSALDIAASVNPEIHKLLTSAVAQGVKSTAAPVVPSVPHRTRTGTICGVQPLPELDSSTELRASNIFGVNRSDDDLLSSFELNDDDFEEFDVGFSANSTKDQTPSLFDDILEEHCEGDKTKFEQAIFTFMLSNVYDNNKDAMKNALYSFLGEPTTEPTFGAAKIRPAPPKRQSQINLSAFRTPVTATAAASSLLNTTSAGSSPSTTPARKKTWKKTKVTQ